MVRGAVLVIDTCGEGAGVALALDGRVREAPLSPRGASSEIVAAVRGLLAEGGVTLAELEALGVVRGPGSFTGVRAGLAAAKGLSEAGGVRMVAVSRLAVLADVSGGMGGVVALDAGRGQLYLGRYCEGEAREWLGSPDELTQMAPELVAVAEEKVARQLDGLTKVVRSLRAADALLSVRRAMQGEPEDAASIDALYLREEADIYRQAGARA